jgi:hypothetical protein
MWHAQIHTSATKSIISLDILNDAFHDKKKKVSLNGVPT